MIKTVVKMRLSNFKCDSVVLAINNSQLFSRFVLIEITGENADKEMMRIRTVALGVSQAVLPEDTLSSLHLIIRV